MFSNRPIKFIGRKEAQEQQRNQLDNVVARRFYIIIGVVIVIATIFALRLFYMQINKSDFYSAKLEQYSTNTFEVDALRGEIHAHCDVRSHIGHNHAVLFKPSPGT